jgi:hypothetical protein
MFHRSFAFLILATSALMCAQGTASVQGHVFSGDGTRLGGATVTISGGSVFVAVTETGTDPGHYLSTPVPPGYYNITVQKDGYRTSKQRTVTVLDAAVTADFVLDPSCTACDTQDAKIVIFGRWHVNRLIFDGPLTFIAVLLFLASIWLVRWHNIAVPNRKLLQAEIDNQRVRFQNETGIPLPPRTAPAPEAGQPPTDVAYLEGLLKSAEEALIWNPKSWSSWFDFLFWTRGAEITGWARIHEFQRGTIKYLATASTVDTIRARLQAITLDLLDIDKAHVKTFAANIKDALAVTPPDENALRALLVESLTFLNDQIDNTFAQLVGWQTKAVWLAGVGCGLIVLLASAVGNPVLFIPGAAGGYLSRLARALKRADVPTDYGASWTTLFLSPIVGALSGWFGILVIVVLADSKFNVLGTAFQTVKWYCPLTPIPLGLAFGLGFSERMFDGIMSALDTKVDNDLSSAKKSQQPAAGIMMAKKDDKKG